MIKKMPENKIISGSSYLKPAHDDVVRMNRDAQKGHDEDKLERFIDDT